MASLNDFPPGHKKCVTEQQVLRRINMRRFLACILFLVAVAATTTKNPEKFLLHTSLPLHKHVKVHN